MRGSAVVNRQGDVAAPWLLLLLDRELGLSLRGSPLETAFRYRNVLFRPVGGGDFNVFLDRLRDGTGGLIGLEVTPAVADLQFSNGLSHLPYAQVIGTDGIFRILFRPCEGVLQLMTDQAFGARIFESEDGVSALSFPAYFLSPTEVAELAKLDRASPHVVDVADAEA